MKALSEKLFIIIFLLIFCLTISHKAFSMPVENKKVELSSSAFKANGLIPKQYTCDGINISPSLSWNNIPENAKSLTLILDDPDAPGRTWVHWIIYNMPPISKGLQEGVLPLQNFSHDTKQGLNDFNKIGYGGPCPPSGTHRYFFKLYALDTKLNLEAGATKKQLENAMKDHILAQAELIGKYKK